MNTRLLKKIAIVCLLCLTLVGCGKSDNTLSGNQKDDLSHARIGTLLGSTQSEYIMSTYKEAKLLEYTNTSEAILAIKTNKLDAFITATPMALMIVNVNEGLKAFDIDGYSEDTAFLFSNNKLDALKEFNDWLASYKQSGRYEEIAAKWTTNFSYDNIIEIPEYTPSKETLKVAASSELAPFVFITNNELTGMSIELIRLFAYETGYGIEFIESNFDGLLAGISSNKYDVVVGDISITEERKKTANFSDIVYTEGFSAIVLKGEEELSFNTIEELNGKTMGCMSGSIFSEYLDKNMADSEILYFNNRDELLLALRQEKIDGYISDKPVGLVNCYENNDIGYIDDPSEKIQYAPCFPKGSALKDQYNEFLEKITVSGKINELKDKWMKESAVNEHYEIPELSGENGTIRVCTTVDAAPFTFFKNNQYEGYEVELTYEFGKEYGYDVEIESTNFGALIASVSSGRFDIAINGLFVTEERSKSVDFSNPVYKANPVAIVRKNIKVENKNIIDSLKEKFIATFISENRYLLIIDGIKTTLLISISSVFLGTILGIVLYLIARKSNVMKKIFDVFYYILSGLPIVVLLMIMFYIVFAKSSLSGIFVSIFGFMIMFGGTVYGLLKTGVDAIDKGQFEAGLALGYTENKTLFKFILPQALRIVMPTYNSEIVSLVKSSSIVGYVTVQDITRVSDLIRSRTYDAFFPLIMTAIIYFFLSHWLNKFINFLQWKFLPNEKNKDRILKDIGQK